MTFDWTTFTAIVLRLFALSLIVQLALEALYRWTGFTALEEIVKRRLGGVGLKFPVAFAVALWISRARQYDVLAAFFGDPIDWSGSLVTALAVAGGTAPFLALFNWIEAIKERMKSATAAAVALRSGGGSDAPRL